MLRHNLRSLADTSMIHGTLGEAIADELPLAVRVPSLTYAYDTIDRRCPGSIQGQPLSVRLNHHTDTMNRREKHGTRTTGFFVSVYN